MMHSKSEPPVDKPPQQKLATPSDRKDFLSHLEIYLAKRDGVDKLLKISRYAAKIVLASSIVDESFAARLKSFEASVGVSRKAFRLGKFVQNVNGLRTSVALRNSLFLSVVAYGGEGFYYFIEQFVWLAKSGLIDKKHLPVLQKWSAWCEMIGYIGSVGLKLKELRKMDQEERCLSSSIEIAIVRGIGCSDEKEKLRKLTEKKMMKHLSVIQDFADALMAMADIRDGRGRLSAPVIVSSAGLLSAVISTHKNWISC